MLLLAIQGAGALAQIGLLLLLGAGAVVWFGHRRCRGGPARTIPLTPQHAVHVVDLDGRRILLGTGPAGAPSLLCTLEGADPSESAPDAALDGPVAPVGRPAVLAVGRRTRWRGGHGPA